MRSRVCSAYDAPTTGPLPGRVFGCHRRRPAPSVCYSRAREIDRNRHKQARTRVHFCPLKAGDCSRVNRTARSTLSEKINEYTRTTTKEARVVPCVIATRLGSSFAEGALVSCSTKKRQQALHYILLRFHGAASIPRSPFPLTSLFPYKLRQQHVFRTSASTPCTKNSSQYPASRSRFSFVTAKRVNFCHLLVTTRKSLVSEPPGRLRQLRSSTSLKEAETRERERWGGRDRDSRTVTSIVVAVGWLLLVSSQNMGSFLPIIAGCVGQRNPATFGVNTLSRRSPTNPSIGTTPYYAQTVTNKRETGRNQRDSSHARSYHHCHGRTSPVFPYGCSELFQPLPVDFSVLVAYGRNKTVRDSTFASMHFKVHRRSMADNERQRQQQRADRL